MTVTIDGHVVELAEPDPIPEDTEKFVGRTAELDLCRAAWGIDSATGDLADDLFAMHFRLQGPAGVGKNAIVYEIVRGLQKHRSVPFYTMVGHEDMTPEDLALLLVPAARGNRSADTTLTLRASPLATAIYVGGLFFFDELSRVPERALAPLASVLDARRSLKSTLTGLRIAPKDEQARARFRFCCALNPELGTSGGRVLPAYIEERTLPVVKLGYPSYQDMREIIKTNLSLSANADALKVFAAWYKEQGRKEISVRRALTHVSLALNRRPANKAGGARSKRKDRVRATGMGASAKDGTDAGCGEKSSSTEARVE